MFCSSTLLALVLASPDAEASPEFRRAMKTALASTMRVAVTTAGDGTIGGVSADLSSESGSESVDLTESDAWMHGGATIKALPETDADLTVTLYDEGSASLITFSGGLSADGSITLSPEKSRLDVGVLAAEVFANPAGGYDVALDLNGADLYSVAYADVRIDEGSTVTTCDKRGCTTTGTITTTKAEVDFDEIGAVWEGELSLAHEGEIEVDVTSYDIDGKKDDKASVTLGHVLHTVQDSFAGGRSLLSAGDAGSLTVIHKEIDKSTPILYRAAIVSDGWTVAEAPTHASLELDGGETLNIPANSFQRAGSTRVDVMPDGRVTFALTINGGNLTINDSAQLTLADFASPVCVDGTCLMLTENEKGTLDLSATGYADTAAGVASSVKIGMVGYDKAGVKASSTDTSVTYDDEVAVVFANEIDFAADPVGLDLSGEVSLLGEADAKGSQNTLSKGDFYGSFTRTEDGDLSLGAMDKNDVQAKGDILIGGEPIDFEKADTNGDGVIEVPPVVFYRTNSNGKGTSATASTTSQTQPQLL